MGAGVYSYSSLPLPGLLVRVMGTKKVMDRRVSLTSTSPGTVFFHGQGRYRFDNTEHQLRRNSAAMGLSLSVPTRRGISRGLLPIHCPDGRSRSKPLVHCCCGKGEAEAGSFTHICLFNYKSIKMTSQEVWEIKTKKNIHSSNTCIITSTCLNVFGIFTQSFYT